MWTSESIWKTKVNADFEGDALGPHKYILMTKDVKDKIVFFKTNGLLNTSLFAAKSWWVGFHSEPCIKSSVGSKRLTHSA